MKEKTVKSESSKCNSRKYNTYKLALEECLDDIKQYQNIDIDEIEFELDENQDTEMC